MDNQLAVDLLKAIREHSGLELASIRDAGSYGAEGGFAGFTYYDDAAAFYSANRETIWQLLADDAEAFGYDNVPAFVGSFNRADMANDATGLMCLCAWYVLETVGRWLNDRREV